MAGFGNDRDTVENLILDLVEWVGRKGRSYQETIDAWRTSCPRLPVWEEATERMLVETASANDRWVVEQRQQAWRSSGKGDRNPMSSYCVEAIEIVASRPSGVTQQPTSRGDERSDPTA